METGSTGRLDDVFGEIRRLGLERHVADLDAYGFTVVDPQQAHTAELIEPVRDAILRIAEQRTGVRPDLEAGSSHAGKVGPTDSSLSWILFEDPAFEAALLNPVGLALITYLLGESCALSIMTGIVKGPGTIPLGLHVDSGTTPAPLPPYALVANVTMLLSDYSRENGALCFVPGSHKWGRHPSASESTDLSLAVPVEAPAGSLVVWGGALWHGAFPRTAPGLRISLANAFCRYFVRPHQPYREHVTHEILDRNPPRFAHLMGTHIFYGYGAEGPDPEKVAARPRSIYD